MVKCAKCNKEAKLKIENSKGEFIPLCGNWACRMAIDLELMKVGKNENHH